MKKILSIREAIEVIKKLSATREQIVLTGGCFDILHIGHIEFLQKAKEHGDVLFVMLESDERIRRTKGKNRPLNSQADRAMLLAQISLVDYIIVLPFLVDNKQYDELVISLKPAIIATTTGDPNRRHKERQAQRVGAKVIDVVPEVKNQSTSRLVKLLDEI